MANQGAGKMKYFGTTALRATAAALAIAIAVAQPISAQARGAGGGHFHSGGGVHADGFHGAGFHTASMGYMHFAGGHEGHWHVHGCGGWGWGGAWPLVGLYDDDDDGYAYDDSPTSTQYWYCQNPAGYYPYVTSCTTTWQPLPAG
jgi:hypothetical protein